LGYCEYIVCRWPWQILGAIRAEARAREQADFFCFLIGYVKLCDGAQMAIFGDFLRPVFSASRVQYVSDLHL